jgi:hypothetical protein
MLANRESSVARLRADHGEEADVTAHLIAAHADLHHGAPSVGVEERHALICSGRHEGPLDPSAPGRAAVWHPELLREQQLAQPTVDLPESSGDERER